MKKFLLFLLLFPTLGLAQTRPDYVQIKNKPAIYAADYGVRADGTDQRTKIQAAVDAAAAANKTLVFGYGTYRASDIVLKSGITIEGQGPGTIIKSNATAANGYVFTVAGDTPTDDVTIRNLVIDGNKTDYGEYIIGGIYFRTTNDLNNPHTSLTFENLTIKNCSFGIEVELGYDVTTKNCRIFSMQRHATGSLAGSYGYGIVYNGCYRSKIVDNLLGGLRGQIDRHCIYLSTHLLSDTMTRAYPTDLLIRGNQMYCQSVVASDPYSIALTMRSPDNVQVIGNNINGGYFAAVECAPNHKDASGVIISDNIIGVSPVGIRFHVGDANTSTNDYRIANAVVTGNVIRNKANTAFIGLRNEICDTLTLANNAFIAHASTQPAVYVGNLATITQLLSLDSIGNTIDGFNVGYYMADVDSFVDRDSRFLNFTESEGYPRLYEYVRNVGAIKTYPQATVEYWELTGKKQISGLHCFIKTLSANVVGAFDGVASYTWYSESNRIRLYGTTAQRPSAATTPLGTKYYNIETPGINTLTASSTSSIPVWEYTP